MEGFFSKSALKRLPVAIQNLPERERMTFVFLRMKRDESFIARELGATIDEARRVIKTVQETLIRTGALDLVQDPVFYRIDHPLKEEDEPFRPYQVAGKEMDIADRIALDQFYQALETSIGQLPAESRRLLGLWFNKEMRAKDILNLYRRLGLNLSSKRSIMDTTEQDIFYALEKNIKKLLELVRTNMKHEEIELTPSSLKAILNETGV